MRRIPGVQVCFSDDEKCLWRRVPMFRRMLRGIQNRASWTVILALVVITGLLAFVMNGIHLSFTTPTIEAHSGGVPILDLRLFYGPEDAHHLMEALGPEGRRAYRILHLVPDVLFPVAYSLTFAFTGAWFLVRLLPREHPLQWLGASPLLAGLADILENLCVVVVGLAYPTRVDAMVRLASAFTLLKWGLMPVGGLLLLVLVILWFARGRPGPSRSLES